MKRLHILAALSVAVLLAGCAAPVAQPQAIINTSPSPAVMAEKTAEPTPDSALASVPIIVVEEDDNKVTFLGDDISTADDQGGIGAAKAEALAATVYGDELAGRPQTYTCEGLAEYNGETYYSIYWSQLVEDGELANNSYMGHFYVSLDGYDVLEGNVDSVFPLVIGGG